MKYLFYIILIFSLGTYAFSEEIVPIEEDIFKESNSEFKNTELPDTFQEVVPIEEDKFVKDGVLLDAPNGKPVNGLIVPIEEDNLKDYNTIEEDITQKETEESSKNSFLTLLSETYIITILMILFLSGFVYYFLKKRGNENEY
jgi:hypothetical protein